MSSGDDRSTGGVADAVRQLERDLRAETARRWIRRALLVLAVVGAFFGYRIYRRTTAPPPKPLYEVKAVELRDVVEQVQSTGVVRPTKEVEIGAQVSGRIVRVLVDFNSRVKEGQLLAEIDPSLFGAQVSQSSAQLRAARAAVSRASANYKTTRDTLKRVKKLYKEGLASSAELEQAKGARSVAKADVGAATAQLGQLRAQLSSARTTLAYTKIYSPIEGTVINRAVDPGQTVAASFSSPVLFVIAQDLKKMQVLADIDEADVGKLKEGMRADVSVDAFPGEKFQGSVTQVRFSPNSEQGVVTYAAVVDVENPDIKLRPGMTASVTVRTREALKATAIPNAALRFRPRPVSSATPLPKLKPLGHGRSRVYRVSGGDVGAETIEPITVKTGITDGVFTELKSQQLKPGAEVVTDQRETKKKGKLF